MKRKIWLLAIVIIVVGFGIFSIVRLATYKPIVHYRPQVKAAETDEVTIAALALYYSSRYPCADINTPTRAINTQIFEGLVGLDKNLKLVPRLAESWDNPDDLTWRFYLRKGVKFHNGDPFTASDVKFTIEETNKKGFIGKHFLANVEKVNVIDDYTIEIKTKEPDPILANKLAFVLIFNKNYLNEDGTINSIGTGPYKLEEWDKDGKYVKLIRNEDYWGEAPKVKRVIWKSFPRDKDRLEAVEKREADIGYLVEGETGLKAGLESKKVKTVVAPDYFVFFLMFDTQRDKTPYVSGVDTNPFKDVRVRKAIYQGIDVEQVIQDALAGFGEARSQMVTSDIFGYNPNIKRYPYDPETAKKLLKEAGYPNGFEVELHTSPYDIYISEAIAKSLKNIGITVKPVGRGGEKGPEDYEKYANGDTSFYGFFCNPDVGDAIGPLVDFFHTPDAEDFSQRHFGIYNFGKYSNPELDRLIEKASKTMNRKERLKYMQEAMAIIHQDVAAIPLFSAEIGYALNPEAHLLFEPRPDDEIRARELAKREIEFIPEEEKKSPWEIIFGW